MAENLFIQPDWPAPANIKAFTTTRKGGFSQPPFNTFNLATHVNDDLPLVLKNRQLLRRHLPREPVWLTQTHTNKMIVLNELTTVKGSYDASATTQK